MDNCSCTCCCYEDFISDCIDSFTIDAGLTPETEYKVIIENKFGQLYIEMITTDAEGVLIIDLAQYPEGMFNVYAGNFNIRVVLDCDDQPLVFDGKEYTCIDLTVKRSTDLKDAIPCS